MISGGGTENSTTDHFKNTDDRPAYVNNSLTCDNTTMCFALMVCDYD